jgi:aconitate hydratase
VQVGDVRIDGGHDVLGGGGVVGVGVDVPELPARVTVRADDVVFEAEVRIETDMELEHYHHGGILPYVLGALVEAG